MILQRLNDALAAPIPFLDKSIERAQVQQTVLQLIILNIGGAFIVTGLLFFFTQQFLWVVLGLVMTITHLPAFIFLKTKKLNLALLSISISVFVTITIGAILQPEFLSILISFYGLNILTTGIFLGSRIAFVTLGISIIIYIWALFFSFDNLTLPMAEPSTEVQIILTVTALVGFGLISHFSIRAIFTAYLQAMKSNNELEEIKHNLEKYSAELWAANQALQANKATKQAIIDSIPDMMAVIDKNGVYCEYKAPSYFRHEDPPEKVIGQKIDDLLSPQLAQERWNHIKHVLATGERVEYEEAQPVRGNPHIFSTRIMAIDENHALIMMRDITEAKQQEVANLVAQKRESVGLLAGGVAHDFNNLLTGMLAQTSLALRKLPSDHSAVKNIRKANIAAERAADLTRQLLAYTGQGSFKIEAVSVNNLIHENVNLIRATLPPSISLNLDLTKKLPFIRADASQIQQIIMNLIINAVEAMHDAEGVIQVSTFVKRPHEIQAAVYSLDNFQPDTEQYVCLQVRDEGSGIPARVLTKIFDPFFSTKSGGRGLGLSATLGIIRRYEGGIQIERLAGRGSCFTVYLPAQTTLTNEPALPKTDIQLQQVHIPQLSGHGILIIDDEAPVREALQDILQMINVKAMSADNGREGVQLFRDQQQNIALIILDMKMPGQSGMETFRELQEIDQTIPILVSSGYTEEEVSRQFADEVVYFLQKPFDAQTLVTALHKIFVKKGNGS